MAACRVVVGHAPRVVRRQLGRELVDRLAMCSGVMPELPARLQPLGPAGQLGVHSGFSPLRSAERSASVSRRTGAFGPSPSHAKSTQALYRRSAASRPRRAPRCRRAEDRRHGVALGLVEISAVELDRVSLAAQLLHDAPHADGLPADRRARQLHELGDEHVPGDVVQRAERDRERRVRLACPVVGPARRTTQAATT